MKMINKKMIIFIAILTFFMSVAVAADVNDTTDITTSEASIATQDTSNVQDMQTVAYEDNNKITKENKNIKKDTASTISVDNTNFDTYFTSTGLNGVDDGDTITFTSNVTRTTNSYIVNKQVNILGNNYTLDLNTIYGYDDDSNPTYIEFNSQASNSNISYLKFHNTQVFTTTASNITFDHITDTIDNQGVGKGTGYFAMRNGVINITVKNSYFNATNNTGCSAIVITLGENCTIDNNTIIGQGTVGNLIYLNLFGATTNANGITQNKNNTISNNTITGPDEDSSICNAITIGGPHNHIINNTINYSGTGIIGNWAGTYDPATNTTNDYYNDTYTGNGYINNTLNNGAIFYGAQRSLVAGNTFTGTASIAKNSTAKNNTFLSTVTLNGYTNFTENTVNGLLTVKGSYNNISLNNLTDITIPSTSTNNNISYNNFDYLVVYSDNNIITYNNYTEDIEDNGSNNIISNNNLVSTLTDNSSNSKNLKKDPVIIEITKDNASTYLRGGTEDDPVVRAKGARYIPVNSIIKFTDDFKKIFPYANEISSPGITYSGNPVTVTGAPGVKFNNVKFTLMHAGMNLENITMNYYPDAGDEYAITTRGNSGENYSYSIKNVTLNYYKENDEYGGGIYLTNNVTTTIADCKINSVIPASQVNWGGNGNSPAGLPITYAIYVNGSVGNAIIENNSINTTQDGSDNSPNPSIFSVINAGHRNIIRNNNFTLNGEHWMYNIWMPNAYENIVANNTIITNSTNYSAGVYLTGGNLHDNIIENNIINITAGFDKERNESTGSPEYVAYGVVVENRAYQGGSREYGYGNVVNTTIANNQFTGSAYNIYGVEIFGGDSNHIENNTVNFTGTTTLGFGAIGYNNSFNNNNITISGTKATGSTVDYLGAGTTGVLIIRSANSTATNNNINSTFYGVTSTLSSDSLVENNNITSEYDYTVLLKNSNNSKVINNYLIAKELKGDSSVENNGTDNNIKNNLPKYEIEYTIKMDTTEFTIGENVTIKASIYSNDNVASNITKGKVAFKVNGKTLKDTNGKVIYAKIINGTATIENYEIPETWNKNGITIEAVYSGSVQCEALRSQKENMTITEGTTPSITTEDINTTKASTITLKATVTGTSKTLNQSKVVFKINGKTVKDANGKVIYAKVSDGQVSFDYTLPETYKAKTYTLTATLICSNYDRLTDTKTLTVND